MKTTYTILLALFFLTCSPTKNLQFDTSNCDFDDKIKDIDKTVDISPYVKGKGGWVLIDNDSLEIGVFPDLDGWKKYIINKKSDIENQIIYSEKSLKIIRFFSFYKKGSFDIGNEYIYNDKGEVIKTIDHNQYNKYPICYKDIIKQTIKKAGRKFYFQGLERDSILKNNILEYSWKVYFEDSISSYPTLHHKFFRIDAKTGKTLTEKIVN